MLPEIIYLKYLAVYIVLYIGKIKEMINDKRENEWQEYVCYSKCIVFNFLMET